jgi:hypothetical protein
MAFNIGESEDIGLAGLPAEPYSFDNGANWVATDTLTVTGLNANTSYYADVLVRDAAGNVSTPAIHLSANTAWKPQLE